MKSIIHNIVAYYTDSGKGKVIVFLHGWGTNGADFASLVAALEPRYRTICVDLPGFGASEQPREDWYIGDYASFVAALLEKLNIKKPYAIVGHSFGGRVIIKGLATEVLDTDKVILIGAAGVKHTDSAKNRALKVITKSGKKVLSLPGLGKVSRRAQRKLYGAIGSRDYLQSGTMKQIFLNTIDEDLSDYAKSIHAPTLLIWGSEDDQAPLADGKFYHRQIAGSRLKIAASAGHFVHHDEPIQVTRWMREFLDE